MARGRYARRGAGRLAVPVVPRGADAAAFVLRVVAGGLMAFHGWRKLSGGVDRFVPSVRSLGIPLPEMTAWLVTLLEFGGGLAIVIGALTRLFALLLAVEMALTTLLVKLDAGVIAPQGAGAGAELDLLFLAAFLALVAIGAGRWSVDHAARLDPAAR
jgi:putative oxidoreductase